MKNKPIALSDGTWLAPASLEGPMPGQKRKQWRAFADISHDLGKNVETEFDYFTERERVREHSADGLGERTRSRAHASEILSR